MRKEVLAVSTAIIAIVSGFMAVAGTWKSDANGWWYDEGNGSFPKSTWSWIDGDNDGVSECYYFDGNGYCLINTFTPDNYFVNPSGAWVVNGVVQTKESGNSADTKSEKSTEVVTGKITIGDSKKKKNKNSSKNNEDDSDYDDSKDEDEDSSSSSKESSEKSNSSIFKNKLDMFTLSIESSENSQINYNHDNLRGNDWYKGLWLNPYTHTDAYAEFYIGGNYKKLTISATPKTNVGFYDNSIAKVAVLDAETYDVLYSNTVNHDTKLFTITADVTDVNYVRIVCEKKDGSEAHILMKDAILTK
ncbi:hypothetical protein SAMN05216349_106124 [Oribacterium sp. KHPX15]|uniref:hypothetical protein n=1 Tax=Oribacterium sp. KHPX15 TaxID=1855342 RepID=UPI00089D6C71|nr:hypothetical protein [Oribacterium sp. KHPX15]SEA20098.1 hypothetical protein SAMN05216349_106124 [Oribacterium sp. KHPX15]